MSHFLFNLKVCTQLSNFIMHSYCSEPIFAIFVEDSIIVLFFLCNGLISLWHYGIYGANQLKDNLPLHPVHSSLSFSGPVCHSH